MRECQTITPIRFRGGNCYLVQTGDGGYFLIDTGFSSQRAAIGKALARAGCPPGTLLLIVLTHGDADHVSNGALPGATYGTRIALHRDARGGGRERQPRSEQPAQAEPHWPPVLVDRVVPPINGRSLKR
jgi:glyoxylase-like metal-dependent hydrolase (beta-lactamase superfamily II)